MEYRKLANGDKMPMIGLGTWEAKPNEVYDAIRHAITEGYRHIDCALIYQNEETIGKALKDALEEGDVDREDLWITSKLWNNAHKPADIAPAIKKTLDDLNLNYLDLYLMHWPVASKNDIIFPKKGEDFISLDEIPLSETWEGMQSLKEKGLAKHLGVCNFSQKKLEGLIENTGITPAVNQVELHPYLQQNDLVEYAEENDIIITAYSPLGRGSVPKDSETDYPVLIENDTIIEIAKELDASPAQVLIRWAIERNTIAIPKSTTPKHITSNLAAANIKLTDEQMNKIAELDRHHRYVDGSFWTVDGSPYTMENLWDE